MLSVSSSKIPTAPASNYKKVSEISKYCTKIAKILMQQPSIRTNNYHSNKTIKLILLENQDDICLFKMINKNAQKILFKEKSWDIDSFKDEQYYNSNNYSLKKGLSLTIYNKFKMCSLKELKNSYDKVLQSITTGWVAAKLEDHPNIGTKKDTNEFALFIKDEDKLLDEEDLLICYIADKFSMEDDIECDTDWSIGFDYYFGKGYLWVKKSALKTVIDKFGFKFQY